MPESAVYPINPPAAHRIANEAEALSVAEQVAAILLQKLAKALNSDEVRQFILTRYKGQIAPGF